MHQLSALSPEAWVGGAVFLIGAVGTITAAIVKSFGGVQDQVRAAQRQLTDDLDRQTDALRAELADVKRRHEAEMADCCERCARCEAALAALERQVAGVKRGKS